MAPRSPPSNEDSSHKRQKFETESRNSKHDSTFHPSRSSAPSLPSGSSDSGINEDNIEYTASSIPHTQSNGSWLLQLCSETDETLRLSRISGNSKHTMSSRSNANAPRGIGDENNALDSYKLETLACATEEDPSKHNDDSVYQSNWCNATVTSQHIIIVAGKQINILSSDCSTQEAVIYHEENITAVATNCDSSFVAFGDEAGMLFIVHIKTRRPVFSQSVAAFIPKPQSTTTPDLLPKIQSLSFTLMNGDGSTAIEELVLIGGTDTVVRFSNIQLCLLNNAILDSDMKLAATIKDKIEIEAVDLKIKDRSLHSSGISGFTVWYSAQSTSYLTISGSGQVRLSRWIRKESAKDSSRLSYLADIVENDDHEVGYIKMLATPNQKYIVALSEDGALNVYEHMTLTQVFCYSDIDIDDFVMLPGSSSESSHASLVIAAISKPLIISSENTERGYDIDESGDINDEEQIRKIVVITLPNRKILYSMNVSRWSWLFHDSRKAQDITDSILFVEGVIEEGCRKLYLRSLNETIPMERLKHYLRGDRFLEAEHFANENNISMGVVYKEKLLTLLESNEHLAALASEKNVMMDQISDVIISMLDQIEDDSRSLVFDVCTQLSIPSYISTKALLAYARETSTSSKQIIVIENIIHRLDTWLFLCTSGTGNPTEFDSSGWCVFRDADLTSYLQSYVADGDISRASILWRKHKNDAHLVDDICSIIQGFPLHISIKSLVGWLRLEVFPDISGATRWNEVATWIEQRARVIEAQQKSPDDALLLVGLFDIYSWIAPLSSNSMVTTPDTSCIVGVPNQARPSVTPSGFIRNSLKTSKWTIDLAQINNAQIFPFSSTSDFKSEDNTAVENCLFLHKQLQDLVHLRIMYRMPLTLDEYEQMSYSMISVELLDRVSAPELLKEAYFEHFIPYTSRHQLDYTQLIHEYCIEIMDSSDREETENGLQNNDSTSISQLNTTSNSRLSVHSWEPRVLQLLDCLCMSLGWSHSVNASDKEFDINKYTATQNQTVTREAIIDTYLTITLEVMRRSSIPWSQGIEKIISDCFGFLNHNSELDSATPRLELDIREQYRLMRLKKMLYTYGLTDFHISNTRMAYPLLQWLVRKTSTRDVMSDALQLVDAYHHLSRTSAYVLRLQFLCEAGRIDEIKEFMQFVDSNEHGNPDNNSKQCTENAKQLVVQNSPKLPSHKVDSNSVRAQIPKVSNDQAKLFYIPLEVACRTIVWIRDVLDTMSFTEKSSKIQFNQYVRAATTLTRTLNQFYLSLDSAGAEGKGTVQKSVLDRLRRFISKESNCFEAIWILLTDGGVMISPGELEQRQTREQILDELLERQVLRPYIDKFIANNITSNSKGKGVLSSILPADRIALLQLLDMPQLPSSIKNISTMLNFSSVELYQRIIYVALSVGLYNVALTVCQDILSETKTTLESNISSTEHHSNLSDWEVATQSFSKCEQEISMFLLSAVEESSGTNGYVYSTSLGSHQGVLIKRLVSLCRAASTRCSFQPQLIEYLDAYSCWELASSVFVHTADGDFATLTKPSSMIMQHNKQRYGYSSEGPRSRVSQSVHTTDSGIVQNRPAADVCTASSSWLAPLFSNTYTERGLVLDTLPTMKILYRLVAVLRRLPFASPETTQNRYDDTKKGVSGIHGTANSSGKSMDVDVEKDIGSSSSLGNMDFGEIRAATIQSCQELVAHLALNRHWILATQALELTISHLARSSFSSSTGLDNANVDEASNALRKRLESGGVSLDELETIFGKASHCDDIGSGGSSKRGVEAIDIQYLSSKSLVRSLQQRGIDPTFIFSCMLMTPPVKAYQHLSTTMSHSGLLPTRVIALANIGSACSLLWQQQALLDRCRSVASSARWSEQLQLLHIPFDVALLNDPKPQMLEPLIRPMLVKTSMDIATVLDFAAEFKLDDTFVILEYISLCCSLADVDGYQTRIIGVEDEITNKALLEQIYTDALYKNISSYDYERLQFVAQRLQRLRPQDTDMNNYITILDVLGSYDRRSTPAHSELLSEWSRTKVVRDMCAQAIGDNGIGINNDNSDPSLSVLLDKIPLSLRRLPFHLLVRSSPWPVLLSELSIDTVEMLSMLAGPLGLNEDDFYMNLIDSIAQKWASTSSTKGSTLTEPACVPTRFNSIQPLLRYFKDPESAITTIKHVADILPCSQDKIAALKTGIKMLHRWGQSIKRMQEPKRSEMMVKAEAIYVHFEKSYSNASAEATLRNNGLDKYAALFTEEQSDDSIVNALTSLYEGECEQALLESRKNNKQTLHDIMRTLAAIYNIRFESLIEKLLQQYLKSPVVFLDTNSDLCLPSARYQASLNVSGSQETRTRNHIIYILRAYTAPDIVKNLLNFAYCKNTGIPCLCRARALDILFSLTSLSDISALQQPIEVQRYLQALLYLADFEYVDIPQSTSGFLECSKAALTRSIWVDYYSNPQAVQLICSLCIDFSVNDRDLMEQILPRLISANMFFYTVSVLGIISNDPCYSTISELPTFWNKAVSGALLHISNSSHSDWIKNALVILNACQNSSHITDIDSPAIIRMLLDTKDKHISENNVPIQLAFVVYEFIVQDQYSNRLLSDYVSNLDFEGIHNLILSLLKTLDQPAAAREACVFVDWRASRALALIFDFIDDKGIHEYVLLRQPTGLVASAYVHNRIHRNMMSAAIYACLERDKRALAIHLVSQYYMAHSDNKLLSDASAAGIKVEIYDNTGGQSADDGATTSASKTLTSPEPTIAKIPDSTKLDIYLAIHNQH